MKKKNLFSLLCLVVLLGLLLAACDGGNDDQLVLEEAPSTEEVSQEIQATPTIEMATPVPPLPTETPIGVMPEMQPANPAGGSADVQRSAGESDPVTDGAYEEYGGAQVPPAASGGNFITTKTTIWSFEDGFNRLITAENGFSGGCSWSNVWRILNVDPALSYYWPHCWELRIEGNGNDYQVFEIELRPDNTEGGYNSSDIHGLGLAFWVTGYDATIQISRDGGATWSPEYELDSSSNGIDFPLAGPTVTLRFKVKGIAYLPLGEKVPDGDLPTW